MSYLIDTCCISELTKDQPDPNVNKWFSSHDEIEMYLSVITFGELIKGIEKLTTSGKKATLVNWVNNDLKHRFRNRVIQIDMAIVKKWGEAQADCERKGTPLPAIDGLIAATALVYDLSVVTRNVKDMKSSGVDIINPWEISDK